jgi:hypothetical protein
MCRSALFFTIDEHLICYYMCREVIKLFRLVLLLHSLMGTGNSAELQFSLTGKHGGGGLPKFINYFRWVALSQTLRNPTLNTEDRIIVLKNTCCY